MTAPFPTDQRSEADRPVVRLGAIADGSLAPTIYVFCERAALLRPERAGALDARVVLRFLDEGHPPVRIEFERGDIVVRDALGQGALVCDLEIAGLLADIVAVVGSPLAGGVPRSRAALARVADGRVAFSGPLKLARQVLAFLAIDPSGRVQRGKVVRRPGPRAPADPA